MTSHRRNILSAAGTSDMPTPVTILTTTLSSLRILDAGRAITTALTRLVPEEGPVVRVGFEFGWHIAGVC